MISLGQLTEIKDLREVWPHEAFVIFVPPVAVMDPVYEVLLEAGVKRLERRIIE